MSSVVQITCTDTQRTRVEDHLTELQVADPGANHDNTTAADNLINLGFMLSRLPPEEIQPVIDRANEIIAGG